MQSRELLKRYKNYLSNIRYLNKLGADHQALTQAAWVRELKWQKSRLQNT